MKTFSMVLSLMMLVLAGCTSRSQTPPPDQMVLIDQQRQMPPIVNNEEEEEIPGERRIPDPTEPRQIDPSRPIPVPVLEDEYVYKKIIWTTTGGGNVDFTITPTKKSRGRFLIHVTGYDFKKVDRKYYIDDTKSLYEELYHLFMGNLEIVSLDAKGYSGSFSKIILVPVNGARKEVDLPSINGDYSDAFSNVLQFIDSRFETTTTTTSSDSSDADEQEPESKLDEKMETEEVLADHKFGCELLPSLEGRWKSTISRFFHGGGRYITSTINADGNALLSKKILKYNGIDIVETTGLEKNHHSSYETKYWYTPKKCRVVQKAEGKKSVFEVYSVGVRKSGKRYLFLENDKTGSIQMLEEL